MKNKKNAKINSLMWLGIAIFLGLPILALVLKSLQAFKTGEHILHENYYYAPVTTGIVIIVIILLVVIGIFWFLGKRSEKNKNSAKKDKLKTGEFHCAECTNIIQPNESKCSKCGWTWK